MPTITGYAGYTKASGSQQVPATGLTVTCTLRIVLRSAMTVTTATPTVTEIGDGVYGANYSTSVDLTINDYIFTFATADATVQQTKIPSLVSLSPADIAAVNATKVNGAGTVLTPWGP